MDRGGEVFVVKFYYYENQGVGIEVYDHKSKELYYRIDVREDEEPSRVETYTAYPYRHANKRNAETYFHRPGNMFWFDTRRVEYLQLKTMILGFDRGRCLNNIPLISFQK